MRANLTNTYVERLPFTDSGTVWHFDISLGGLQLAVGKRTKTFYCEATHGGKMRRVKIGRADIMTASEARRKARDEVLPALRNGIDLRPPKPAPVVHDDRPTFREAFVDYRQHGTQAKGRTLNAYERTLDFNVPEYWNLACADITAEVVQRDYRRLTRGSVESAKSTFRIVSAVMHHAVRTQVIGPNDHPTVTLPRGWATATRNPQRIGDLDRWWRRTDELDMIPKSILRMLLLTGFRPGEVKSLRWEHVDLDAGKVRLLDVKRGPDRDAAIPKQVVHLLRRVKKMIGHPVHVFPSPTSGAGHIIMLPGKPDIGWAPKDCRNEWDSVAAEIGIAHAQRAAQMGHSAGNMTDSYIVTPDVSAAVQKVADEIYERTKETRRSR